MKEFYTKELALKKATLEMVMVGVRERLNIIVMAISAKTMTNEQIRDEIQTISDAINSIRDDIQHAEERLNAILEQEKDEQQQ